MHRQPAWLVTALFAGLTGCSSGSPPAEPMGAAAADTGARIYRGNCVPCHQENGLGLAGVYPSLAGSTIVLGDPTALARWVVKGQRPAGMPIGRFSTVMPQFGWLNAPDAAALLTYLRSQFGNAAVPVTPPTVAQAIAE